MSVCSPHQMHFVSNNQLINRSIFSPCRISLNFVNFRKNSDISFHWFVRCVEPKMHIFLRLMTKNNETPLATTIAFVFSHWMWCDVSGVHEIKTKNQFSLLKCLPFFLLCVLTIWPEHWNNTQKNPSIQWSWWMEWVTLNYVYRNYFSYACLFLAENYDAIRLITHKCRCVK